MDTGFAPYRRLGYFPRRRDSSNVVSGRTKQVVARPSDVDIDMPSTSTIETSLHVFINEDDPEITIGVDADLYAAKFPSEVEGVSFHIFAAHGTNTFH